MIRLPAMTGGPICVSVRPRLSRHAGRLLFENADKGIAVHAACFIRERRIILEEALLRDAGMLRLILIHELFHFVWPRLANRTRAQFSQLLLAERKAHARGELGESADMQKSLVASKDDDRRWREYICESFCDTAAWFCAGLNEHPAFTLAARWRAKRAAWFQSILSGGSSLKY